MAAPGVFRAIHLFNGRRRRDGFHHFLLLVPSFSPLGRDCRVLVWEGKPFLRSLLRVSTSIWTKVLELADADGGGWVLCCPVFCPGG